MQLVRRGDPRAFELVYDRHSGAAFSPRLPDGRHARPAEDVVQEAFLVDLARRRALRRARAAPCAPGCSASSTTVRSTRCAARYVHDRRRASDEGIEERFAARERTEVEAARREEARTSAPPWTRCRPSSRTSSSSPTSAASPTPRSRTCSTTPVGTVKGRMRLGLREAARPARLEGGGAVNPRAPATTAAGPTGRRLRARRAQRRRGRGRSRQHLRDVRDLPPGGRRPARGRRRAARLGRRRSTRRRSCTTGSWPSSSPRPGCCSAAGERADRPEPAPERAPPRAG